MLERGFARLRDGLALALRIAMRETDPNLIPFDPEEFASSPFLEAEDELRPDEWTLVDIHERPTLVP
jgi:hypothetical protein